MAGLPAPPVLGIPTFGEPPGLFEAGLALPFLLVVGDKEAEAGKVNVRSRGKEKTEDMPATEFVEKIRKLIAAKAATL